MRPRSAVALAVPVMSLLSLSLAGCAESGGTRTSQAASGTPAGSTSVDGGAKQQAAPALPRTPEEFLARAREAMAGHKGWTFTVKGNEGLVAQGHRSTATYTATVQRIQSPMTLRSTGTTYAKGAAKPEEVYVVDGTGYVRRGGAGSPWKSGPLSDPEIANVVEDPVAALAEFQDYAREESGDAVSIAKSSGLLELRVEVSSGKLPAVRNRGVVKKAFRELAPTLGRLRAAGVTATENQVSIERVEEVLALDPSTYRIRSHRFRCTLLIPYSGRTMSYSQDTMERTQGVFTGTITLPKGIG